MFLASWGGICETADKTLLSFQNLGKVHISKLARAFLGLH
jgi:hypothetical protein